MGVRVLAGGGKSCAKWCVTAAGVGFGSAYRGW